MPACSCEASGSGRGKRIHHLRDFARNDVRRHADDACAPTAMNGSVSESSPDIFKFRTSARATAKPRSALPPASLMPMMFLHSRARRPTVSTPISMRSVRDAVKHDGQSRRRAMAQKCWKILPVTACCNTARPGANRHADILGRCVR